MATMEPNNIRSQDNKPQQQYHNNSNRNNKNNNGNHKRPYHQQRNNNNNNNSKRRRHRNNNHHSQVEAGQQQKHSACSVCKEADKVAKYKCPKCRALYCSVVCCKYHKEVCGAATAPATSTTTGKTAGTTNKNSTTTCKAAATTTTTLSPYEKILLSLQPKSSSLNHNISGRHHNQHQNKNDDSDDDDDPNWNISTDMKDSVRKSKWLSDQLQDGGLRDVLEKIVELKNPTNLEEVTQHYPQFATFIDKLLVLAGILERSDNENGRRSDEPQQDADKTSCINNSHDAIATADMLNHIVKNESDLPIEDWLNSNIEKIDPSWQQRLTLKPLLRKKIPVFQPVDNNNDTDSDEDSSSSSAEEEELSDSSSNSISGTSSSASSSEESNGAE